MIELFEGVPGSGKSYYAVAERFLPAVRRSRRIYCHIDGIYLDRLAVFTGIPVADLQKQITIWTTAEQVKQELERVEPMSFVIIDEAQTVFRALEKVEKGLSRWLEMHRHYGVDILLMCQDYRQLSQQVTRLVEVTIKFRKLSFVGLHNHYQAKVRGNPDDTTEIRKLAGKYDPAIYSYYASYAQSSVREVRHSHSVWRSGAVVVGVVGLGFGLCVMVWRPWTSLADKGEERGGGEVRQERRLKEEKRGGEQEEVKAGVSGSEGKRSREGVQGDGVVIVGGGGTEDNWYYVLADGRVMTASQIAGKFGIEVREVVEGPFVYLRGEGVRYGPGGN